MGTPEDSRRATQDFLEEYPESEATLLELIELDADQSTWSFDDVELDSGRFGELVSRGIATKADNGDYRLRNREAITAALDGEPVSESYTDDRSSTVDFRSKLSLAVDRREIAGVVVALLTIVAARLIASGSVFRDGYLVSPGNDPYFYRYWQAQLLDQSDGVTDIGVLADLGGASSRPLTHSVNWWLAELLGGTPAAADFVAAWLPVGGAVAIGVVLYLLTKLLTGDPRIGFAAVGFLGLAPVHIVYTNVGFLEHRVHQYLWLGILALTLTWLAIDVQRRHDQTGDGQAAARGHLESKSAWLAAGGLALSVAASAHIWTGSPLTFVPVALYVGLRVVADVRADIPPLLANGPLLGGLVAGGIGSAGLHFGLGWHGSMEAAIPLVVAGGAVAIAGVGELWRHRDLPAKSLLAVQAIVAIGSLVVFRLARPGDVERLISRADDLFLREGATEATSLFTTDLSVVLGPISQIGISFYLGLAGLLVMTWFVSQEYSPEWLVVVCFSWWYMLLAAFQARFAGQLTFFIALFAGLVCLYGLAKIELVGPVEVFDRDSSTGSGPIFEIPTGQRAAYLSVAIGLLLLLNFIYAPTLVGQTTYSDEQFEATMAISEHVESTDRGYPDSAVETRWADIRMYNYFVNGEASSYSSNYESFLTAENPDEVRTGLREGGTYIVIGEREGMTAPGYTALYDGLGVGLGKADSTGHFQPVYVGQEVRAFTVVEGAVLEVSGSEGTEVTASTTVSVDGEEVLYERSAVVDDGGATIRVAHPGTYTIGDETVDVSEEAVYGGEVISVMGDG